MKKNRIEPTKLESDPNIFHEGNMINLSTGRWSIGSDWEITSGDCFEVKIGDQWIPLRMESVAGRYYTIPKMILYNGIKARQRLF